MENGDASTKGEQLTLASRLFSIKLGHVLDLTSLFLIKIKTRFATLKPGVSAGPLWSGIVKPLAVHLLLLRAALCCNFPVARCPPRFPSPCPCFCLYTPRCFNTCFRVLGGFSEQDFGSTSKCVLVWGVKALFQIQVCCFGGKPWTGGKGQLPSIQLKVTILTQRSVTSVPCTMTRQHFKSICTLYPFRNEEKPKQ